MRKKANSLTEQEKNYIRANYKGTTCKEMVKRLLKEFGVEHGRTQIQNFYQNNGLKSGLNGQFKKGSVSFNKGKKQTDYMTPEQIERSAKTRFNKGHINDNAREPKPVGSRTCRKDGYVYVKVAQPHKWVPEHYLVWEKYHGKRDPKLKIVHLDGDSYNNDIDNLYQVNFETMSIINRDFKLVDKKDINESIVKTAALQQKILERKRNEGKSISK